MRRLAENLAAVKARIHTAAQNSVRSSADIQLIAVSKTKPVEDIRAAYDAGQRDFGENYLQDALPKIEALNESVINNKAKWHFIGPIQSNKTRQIAEYFDWVQSIDRVKIAKRLNDQRPNDMNPLNVCIQINLDEEVSKSGVSFHDAKVLASQIIQMPKLCLRGLMFIPAPQPNEDSRLTSCQRACAIFDALKNDYPQMDTLSLGMSADLEQAIAAGSTMVRIGTDIFGQRQK